MRLYSLAILLAFSSTATAQEFWANRLGGGAGDVMEKNILFDKFKSRYRSAIVKPVSNSDGELVYKVALDSDATVQIFGLSDSTPVSQLAVKKISAPSNGRIFSPASVSKISVDSAPGTGAFNLTSGEWSITLPETTSSKSNSELNSTIAVIDHAKSNYALAVALDQTTIKNGSRVALAVNATENVDEELESGGYITGSVLPVRNVTAIAEIRYPDGKVRTISLMDNGKFRKGDANEGDFVYSARENFTVAGNYEININFKGEVDEAPFQRTSYLNVTVDEDRVGTVDRELHATLGHVLDSPLEEQRYGLPLAVNMLRGEMPDYLDTRAEIWAKDGGGNDIVVGWIGGMVKPVKTSEESYTIPMSFHSGWLAKASFHPPVTLRKIELNDIDSGDQLLYDKYSVELLDIDMSQPKQTKGMTSAVSLSTAEMEMGTHPSLLTGASRKAGPIQTSKIWAQDLLFIRGWCATGRQPVSHFSETIRNKALFDIYPVKGQTAERRAVEIMDKVLLWLPRRLRGAVAHSQGGLVAATLLQNYSYVFADSALSRPPNVVSIGAPYNGSYLADKSSSELGKLLAGLNLTPSCSVPFDIRKSQNSRWRSKIGWRAKYQISSWNTSHGRSYWYREKGCSLASFSILSGRDDGLVKQSEGMNFADGGDYFKKDSGYCHTRSSTVYLGIFSPFLGNKVIEGKDQWKHPSFVTHVNNLFHNDTESWQPF